MYLSLWPQGDMPNSKEKKEYTFIGILTLTISVGFFYLEKGSNMLYTIAVVVWFCSNHLTVLHSSLSLTSTVLFTSWQKNTSWSNGMCATLFYVHWNGNGQTKSHCISRPQKDTQSVASAPPPNNAGDGWKDVSSFITTHKAGLPTQLEIHCTHTNTHFMTLINLKLAWQFR